LLRRIDEIFIRRIIAGLASRRRQPRPRADSARLT
jgi:hypothetical protein